MEPWEVLEFFVGCFQSTCRNEVVSFSSYSCCFPKKKIGVKSKEIGIFLGQNSALSRICSTFVVMLLVEISQKIARQ